MLHNAFVSFSLNIYLFCERVQYPTFVPRRMKLKVIHTLLSRFICWILLLQMINISVNPPDSRSFKFFQVQTTEDLSFNETESLYELISETVFDLDVPETEDEDIDISWETPELFCLVSKSHEGVSFSFLPRRFFTYQQGAISVHLKISSPPPKVAYTHSNYLSS